MKDTYALTQEQRGTLLRMEVDLYIECIDTFDPPLSDAAIADIHKIMWAGAGNRIPGLLAWAAQHGVTAHCPHCSGSGRVTVALDINSVVSVPTDAPCPVCNPQAPAEADSAGESLP